MSDEKVGSMPTIARMRDALKAKGAKSSFKTKSEFEAACKTAKIEFASEPMALKENSVLKNAQSWGPSRGRAQRGRLPTRADPDTHFEAAIESPGKKRIRIPKRSRESDVLRYPTCPGCNKLIDDAFGEDDEPEICPHCEKWAGVDVSGNLSAAVLALVEDNMMPLDQDDEFDHHTLEREAADRIVPVLREAIVSRKVALIESRFPIQSAVVCDGRPEYCPVVWVKL